MKLLLGMLIQKLDHPWWRLRWSTGDPPEEREGHYILSALRKTINVKLNEAEKEDENNS